MQLLMMVQFVANIIGTGAYFKFVRVSNEKKILIFALLR